MRKLVIILFIISVAGCVSGPSYPKGFRGVVKTNHLRNEAYLRHMDKGNTTRDQDMMMIKANSKAWRQLHDIMEASK